MTRKTAILLLIPLLVCSCRRQQPAFKFADELNYSQKNGDIYVADYLTEDTSGLFRRGWSRLRKSGTRLGAYPQSKMVIRASKIRPLFMFFSCRPYQRDKFPAKSFQIYFNRTKVSELHFGENAFHTFQIAIPEFLVNVGDNILDLVYSDEPNTDTEAVLEQREKNLFALIFRELLVSSLKDYRHVKTVREHLREYSQKQHNVFIQKVPGQLKFFFEIPPDSLFKSRIRFIPIQSETTQNGRAEIQISLQTLHTEETILCRSRLGINQENSFSLKLSDMEGMARLRLKVGHSEKQAGIKGFVVWSGASIFGKKQDRARIPDIPNKTLSQWRQAFSQKNTIIIILDAARADHFSSYGYHRPTTPNIDKFAGEAVVFTNAFSEALTTRCSIGTLFTGFPLTVTSLVKTTSVLPDEFPTLAGFFQTNGFTTTGYTGVGNVGSAFNFDKGFDQYFDLYKEENFKRKSQQYLPYLLPWLEANQDNPFFLYVHFKEPHSAYIPLPPFQGMFSRDYEEKIELNRINDLAQDLTDEQVEYIVACYDETLASADDVVGQVLTKLKLLGLLEKSIIFLTADHGEMLGEQERFFGHGGFFGEGNIHIPLIIRFPRDSDIDIPRRIDSLVKLSDIFATLADIYGFDIPSDVISGRSLLPLLSGAQKEINPHVTIEKRGTRGYCYRSKQHKVNYWLSGPPEYYDLVKDPSAVNNIYSEDDILVNFLLTQLKKYVDSQRILRDHLLKGDALDKVIEYDRIDKATLENLKTLGYIK